MNYSDNFRQFASAIVFSIVLTALSYNPAFAAKSAMPAFSIPVDNAPFLPNSSIRFSSNENRSFSHANRARLKPFSSSTRASSNDIRPALTSLLKEVSREPNIVNSLLAYSTPAAKQSFSLAYGLANPETRAPMSGRHQFHIGSMSKVFTATLLLQLVEEGYFAIDTELGEIFGDRSLSDIFPNHTFTAKTPEGIPIGQLTISDIHGFGGETWGQEIKISDLINHTHGMPDLLFDDTEESRSLEFYLIADSIGFPTDKPGISQTSWTGENLLEYYISSGLPERSLFRPGDGFHYGGTGFVLAGLIVEKFTGLSLDQAYRLRILDPVGMDDTYLFGFEAPRESNSAGLSHRFFDLSEAGIEGIGNVDITAADWNTTSEWGSSGLVSTVSDLNRFYRSLLSGNLFSDPDTVMVLTDYVEISDGYGIGNAYSSGLGIVIDWVTRDVIAIEHSGYWGSYFIYVPETDSSVIVTTNQAFPASSGFLRDGIRNILIGNQRGCPIYPDVSDLERKLTKYERQIALLKKKLVEKNIALRRINRARVGRQRMEN